MHQQAKTQKLTVFAANVTIPIATGRLLVNVGDMGNQDVAGVALNDSGKSGFDVGYQHDMSANTYTFVRYVSTETGVNFGGAAGSQEATAFMAGIVFSY